MIKKKIQFNGFVMFSGKFYLNVRISAKPRQKNVSMIDTIEKLPNECEEFFSSI